MHTIKFKYVVICNEKKNNYLKENQKEYKGGFEWKRENGGNDVIIL